MGGLKKRTLRILDNYIRILLSLHFLHQEQLSTEFYIECAYNENVEMIIDLLKLVGFGKEEDKEERSEHEKETKVLLYCACPEAHALRGDMIIAIHSDFKTGHGTYHYYTFFICIK